MGARNNLYSWHTSTLTNDECVCACVRVCVRACVRAHEITSLDLFVAVLYGCFGSMQIQQKPFELLRAQLAVKMQNNIIKRSRDI